MLMPGQGVCTRTLVNVSSLPMSFQSKRLVERKRVSRVFDALPEVVTSESAALSVQLHMGLGSVGNSDPSNIAEHFHLLHPCHVPVSPRPDLVDIHLANQNGKCDRNSMCVDEAPESCLATSVASPLGYGAQQGAPKRRVERICVSPTFDALPVGVSSEIAASSVPLHPVLEDASTDAEPVSCELLKKLSV